MLQGNCCKVMDLFLLFSNNSFGPPFLCDVRNIYYSVELIMVASYFNQKWDHVFQRSRSLSSPKCRKCNQSSPRTGARNWIQTSLSILSADMFILFTRELHGVHLCFSACALLFSPCSFCSAVAAFQHI